MRDATRATFPVHLTTGEHPMPLMNLIIVLVVVGVILFLINNYVPMDGKIKSILNVVVVIGVILWLLQAFGVLSSLG
jgi:membrane-bound ClpP family serine protease